MRPTWHCALGCGDVPYSPELYGADGPIPLHHVLTHETNERSATNGPLTVGLMAEKGADMAAPDDTLPMTDKERWEHLQEALAVKRRAEALQPVLRHYTAMLAERMEAS